MMKNAVYLLLIVFTFFTSCATEKFNVSPLNNSLSTSDKKRNLKDKWNKTITANVNASEITNLIATFPKFRNEAVNKEISKLKSSLQNYLYAYDAYNMDGRNRSMQKVKNSYRKIQKLRQYLNEDEDEVVNRYLVRIKTNLSILESSDTEHK